MINPIDGTASPLAYGISAATAARTQAAAPVADVVTISDEAEQRYQFDLAQRFRADLSNTEEIRRSQAEAQAADPGSRWWMTSGMQEGTFTLENGNKQVVSIDGDKLEIMEYDGDRLVKSVKGTLYDGGVSLDTEYYDKSGKVSQAIHTDIEEMEGQSGWTTARMRRSVQWFDGGTLKGEMQDSMLLNSWSNVDNADGEDTAKQLRRLLGDATDKVAETVDEFRSDLTLEKHIADYYAEYSEYGDNGRLSQEMSVEYEGRHTQLSNRGYRKNGDMDARSTTEVEHDTGLEITLRSYDADGELVRDASFSDRQKDNNFKSADGRQEQSLAVSWYNGGELVKRSHGSMTLEETAYAALPDRPSLLETLDLSAEDYLGDEPQSATELLARGVFKSSSEPDFFMEGVMRHAAGNDYGTAEAIGDYGADRPYSVDWTDELYREGELVQRRSDGEAARETTFAQRERAILFQTGRGLTENEVPVVLRETTHEHEAYRDGEVVERQETRARESIERSDDRADTIVTDASMVQGVEGREKTTAFQIDGTVDTVDRMPHGAAEGFGREARLTLDGFIGDVRAMNEDDVSDREALHVRFDYRSIWTD